MTDARGIDFYSREPVIKHAVLRTRAEFELIRAGAVGALARESNAGSGFEQPRVLMLVASTREPLQERAGADVFIVDGERLDRNLLQ